MNVNFLSFMLYSSWETGLLVDEEVYTIDGSFDVNFFKLDENIIDMEVNGVKIKLWCNSKGKEVTLEQLKEYMEGLFTRSYEVSFMRVVFNWIKDNVWYLFRSDKSNRKTSFSDKMGKLYKKWYELIYWLKDKRVVVKGMTMLDFEPEKHVAFTRSQVRLRVDRPSEFLKEVRRMILDEPQFSFMKDWPYGKFMYSPNTWRNNLMIKDGELVSFKSCVDWSGYALPKFIADHIEKYCLYDRGEDAEAAKIVPRIQEGRRKNVLRNKNDDGVGVVAKARVNMEMMKLLEVSRPKQIAANRRCKVQVSQFVCPMSKRKQMELANSAEYERILKSSEKEYDELDITKKCYENPLLCRKKRKIRDSGSKAKAIREMVQHKQRVDKKVKVELEKFEKKNRKAIKKDKLSDAELKVHRKLMSKADARKKSKPSSEVMPEVKVEKTWMKYDEFAHYLIKQYNIRRAVWDGWMITGDNDRKNKAKMRRANAVIRTVHLKTGYHRTVFLTDIKEVESLEELNEIMEVQRISYDQLEDYAKEIFEITF
jgi:hypothetical protein